MEFNNTSTKDALIQSCESLCNLGDAGITGNSILLSKFTSYINQAFEKIAMAILTVDKNWRWDDVSSYGNFAVATADLVDGQRDYVLPRATNSADQSTLWKVYKVRLKDTNGEWYDLTPLPSDAAETSPEGRPTQYRLLGNSVRLSDIPNTGSITLTAGIQVWYQRAFTKFTSSDTTKQPVIMSSYHQLLPLDASATHLLPIDFKLANQYLALFERGLEKLKDSYALRNDDPKITKRLNIKVEDTR